MHPFSRPKIRLATCAAVLAAAVLAFPASAGIPAVERAALLDLFASTGGPTAWKNRSGWLGSAGTECTWYGIRCDASGATIVEISLPLNNLTGRLPAGLANLKGLEQLDLSYNNLTGSISGSSIQLPRLRNLNLQNNELTGAIPAELYQVLGLEELRLDLNGFSGPIPPTIGQLSALRVLSLRWNDLGGTIPVEIGDLGNLEVVELAGTRLEGMVPSSIGRLRKLRLLSLSFNRLTGQLPPELWHMSNLEGLDLAANAFYGRIPPDISNLTALRWIVLTHNRFSGPIPEEIGQLTSLRQLFLAENNLEGEIPLALGNLKALKYLQLSANKLEGSIPGTVGELIALEMLQLNGNKLAGELPPSFQNLTRVVPGSLDLRFNMLKASDPGVGSWADTRQPSWRTTQVLPPHNIVVASVTSSSVVLRWESDVSGIPVWFEVSGDSGQGPMVLRITAPGQREVGVSNLLPGTNYIFTLRTKSGGHVDYNLNQLESEPSAPVSAKTLPPPFPMVRAEDERIVEGNEGSAVWTVRVALSSASESTARVTWKTVEGTAHAGLDFVSAGPSTLTFAPGETEKLVSIEVLGDTLIEPDEVLHLELSDPVNLRVGLVPGTITILDDDGPTIPPDPLIEVDGCSTLGVPCTVRVKSKTGRSVVDWQCEWRQDSVVKATGKEWKPTFEQAGVYTILLQAANRAGVAATTATLKVAQPEPDPEEELDLLGGRFALSITARDHRTGGRGAGLPIRRNDRFGYFSIPDLTSNPQNPEVFVKMLDGRNVTGSFWVFFGGLTDLEYTLRVEDTFAGTARTYLKPFGTSAGGFDVGRGVAAEECQGEVDGVAFDAYSIRDCIESHDVLCLSNGRFHLALEAKDPRTGAAAAGFSLHESDLFGYFAIPGLTGDTSNPEVFVKVLDGRAVNGFFWVFYGGLTDLEYWLTITDTETGVAKRYVKAEGSACGAYDINAF